jgi:hypothetical protein
VAQALDLAEVRDDLALREGKVLVAAHVDEGVKAGDAMDQRDGGAFELEATDLTERELGRRAEPDSHPITSHR